jgi:RNA polymerase sigma-70 factor (ECF subfamily)
MSWTLPANSSETNRRLQGFAVGGDEPSWAVLLERHRDRLRRMITLRLDRRLQDRVGTAEVIGQVEREATRRRGEFLREPSRPFFLWLRQLAGESLRDWRRRLLGSEARSDDRAVLLYRGALPAATTAALAAQLLGVHSQPGRAAERIERKLRLQEALNVMDPLEREVLALRHFERLSNAEAASVLEIAEASASTSYIRALKRLKEILAALPGGP